MFFLLLRESLILPQVFYLLLSPLIMSSFSYNEYISSYDEPLLLLWASPLILGLWSYPQISPPLFWMCHLIPSLFSYPKHLLTYFILFQVLLSQVSFLTQSLLLSSVSVLTQSILPPPQVSPLILSLFSYHKYLNLPTNHSSHYESLLLSWVSDTCEYLLISWVSYTEFLLSSWVSHFTHQSLFLYCVLLLVSYITLNLLSYPEFLLLLLSHSS